MPDDPASAAPPSRLEKAARSVFGDRVSVAERYAQLLMTDGVVRGLIGPREAPRIWDRHLLNSVAVAELVPPDAAVIDVGSGAGLPGVVLAIARPDITMTLLEPLARRAIFLREVVEALELGRVTVARSRAEEYAPGLDSADIVVSRAVAPLDRLAGWCLPLTMVGGRMLALKGSSAADEIAEYAAAIRRLGGAAPVIRRCGVGLIDPPTTVVDIRRDRTEAGTARRR